MITPEDKDHILIELINSPNREWLNIDSNNFNVPAPVIESLFRQFHERGFIKLYPPTKNGPILLTVEIDADDFIQRGGYKFQEDIFRNNFTKLELELAKLEKENPAINFKNVTTLISTVASGIEIYNGLIK